MARFIFKLDGVLRHRQHVERQRQRELAAAQAAAALIEADLRALDLSMQESLADLRQNRLVGKIDLAFLAAHRRYLLSVQRRAGGLLQKLTEAQGKVHAAQRAFAEAATARKAIEKLRDRSRERWREQLSRREMTETDEIGMQLSFRESLEAADSLHDEAAGEFARAENPMAADELAGVDDFTGMDAISASAGANTIPGGPASGDATPFATEAGEGGAR
jgi:flagellar export protein FliJ